MDNNSIITIILSVGAVCGAIATIWGLMNRITNKFQEFIRKELKPIEEKLIRADIQLEDLKKSVEGGKMTDKELVSVQLEQTKKIVRDMHSKMRRTGTISDDDMSYAEKLYPHYLALGGNSDVVAKMNEMRKIYEARVNEKINENHKKKKQTATTTEDGDE